MEYAVGAAGLLLTALGLAVVWALWRRGVRAGLQLVARAEAEARRIVAQSEIEVERITRDGEIAVRERLLEARTEFERETREQRLEVAAFERRLE